MYKPSRHFPVYSCLPYTRLYGFTFQNTATFRVTRYVTSSKLPSTPPLLVSVLSAPCCVSNAHIFLLAGLPYVRPMPPIPAVAGQQLVVKCPVAGYPIDTIIWDKGKSLVHGFFVVHVNMATRAAS